MKSNKDNRDLFEKRKVFKIFTILAFSFLLLGIIYIHLIVLKTKSLLIIKNLEDKKRRTSFQNSNFKNKYIRNSNLYIIEEKAKNQLNMFYPNEVIYFDITDLDLMKKKYRMELNLEKE